MFHLFFVAGRAISLPQPIFVFVGPRIDHSVKDKSYLYTAVGILLLVIGLIVAFQNSLVVTGVSIKLIPGIKEHRDHSFGKIGKEHELPDYRVKLNLHRSLSNIDLGTRLNVSAAE